MTLQQILSADISLQTAIWKPIDKEVSIDEILQQIKSQSYRKQVLSLRNLLKAGDLEGYGMGKRHLPAVTFCGTFDKVRKKENLLCYNHLIVLDIDKLSIGERARVRDVLLQCPYVFAFWASPSGKGFKGLVALDYQIDWQSGALEKAHKSAFQLVRDYFETTHQVLLDESGSDLTRLCFLSYDPDLILKSEITVFPVTHVVSAKRTTIDTGAEMDDANEKRLLQFKNQPLEMQSIERIIAYLQNTNQSITESYGWWFRVAFALCEAFTFKVGLAYFLTFSEMDGPDYDEAACRNLYYYCYKNATGQLKLSTVVFYAKKKGYQPTFDHPQNLSNPDEKNV